MDNSLLCKKLCRYFSYRFRRGRYSYLLPAHSVSERQFLFRVRARSTNLTQQPSSVLSMNKKNNSLSDSSITDSFSGIASYYADRFQGRRTSCGEMYCHDSLTAAHRSLPFGTLLYVQNIINGKAVIVRVNDRGPFKPGRCLDVSKRAAHELGIIGKGTGTITSPYHRTHHSKKNKHKMKTINKHNHHRSIMMNKSSYKITRKAPNN
jgi:rare lipoprotein A (peptidoglycan hydrolase)